MVAGLHATGSFHALRGEWPAAEAFFRRALTVDPQDPIVRHALAVSLLGQGRYHEGFPLYAGRTAIPALNVPKPRLPFPEWRGEDLKGRSIVIFPEQGFGDQIMLARFAPVLRDLGADVTLLCSPQLERLFAATLGVRVISASGLVDFPDPAFWTLIGDLPGYLTNSADDVPGTPYLSVSAERRGGIGLVRNGNPRHVNDANRSLPADLVLPFATTSLAPLDTGAADFLDTAQIVAGLDGVVTVDTSVAHLAGAMGKPTWIMLPAHGTDWRWMAERADSSWYPSARLYRQRTPGDWTRVVAEIAAAVADVPLS
jgi:hypothetical protein